MWTTEEGRSKGVKRRGPRSTEIALLKPRRGKEHRRKGVGDGN
jgi:hypothetical protein